MCLFIYFYIHKCVLNTLLIYNNTYFQICSQFLAVTVTSVRPYGICVRAFLNSQFCSSVCVQSTLMMSSVCPTTVGIHVVNNWDASI